MVGAEIPDGVVYGIIPVVLGGMMALLAYIVRTLGKVDGRVAANEKDLTLHNERILYLERRRSRS